MKKQSPKSHATLPSKMQNKMVEKRYKKYRKADTLSPIK
jgi:hypothetical protein